MLVAIEVLGDKIIRAGFDAADDVGFVAAAGEDDDVGIDGAGNFADQARPAGGPRGAACPSR